MELKIYRGIEIYDFEYFKKLFHLDRLNLSYFFY